MLRNLFLYLVCALGKELRRLASNAIEIASGVFWAGISDLSISVKRVGNTSVNVERDLWRYAAISASVSFLCFSVSFFGFSESFCFEFE